MFIVFMLYKTVINYAISFTYRYNPKPIEFTLEDFFQKRSKILTSFKGSNNPYCL
jgi:hypothetical protein